MESFQLTPLRVEDLMSVCYGDFFQTYGYRALQEIGQGGSSVVVLSQPDNGRDLEAVKMISKQIGLASKKCFETEVSFLGKIRHKHIMQMNMACECLEMFVISVPYCHQGTLHSHIPTITTQMTDKWLIQLTSAVLYLHTRHIAHRDIKPGNILISKEGNVVLSDFGLARDVQPDIDLLREGFGTIPYLAPEAAMGHFWDAINYYKCDMYSIGMVLWSMVIRDVAWPGQTDHLARLPVETFTPGCYTHLIENLLNSDPYQRWNCNKLVRTLWVTWQTRGHDLAQYFGLMSGLTMGLLSLDQTTLLTLKDGGTRTERKHANRILPVVKRHHLLLVTLLLANAVAVEGMPLFLDRVSNPIIAIVISVTAVLIFGEVIPQAVCTRYGLAIGSYLTPVVYFLMAAFFVIAYPLSKLLDLMLGEDHGTFFRRGQLKALIDIHGEEGGEEGEGGRGKEALSKDEVSIIKGALDMKNKTAKDAMVSIHKVFMLDINGVLDDGTMSQIIEKGHSRLPICDGSNILAFILTKTLIKFDPEDAVALREIISDRQYAREPMFIEADMPLFDLLNVFQTGRSHLAFVKKGNKNKNKPARVNNSEADDTESTPLLINIEDEETPHDPMDGEDVIGIITLEDVIEELLQEEIDDELDVSTDMSKKLQLSFIRLRKKSNTSKFQAIPGILNRRSKSKSPKQNRRSKSPKSPKENRRSRSPKSPKENRRSKSPKSPKEDRISTSPKSPKENRRSKSPKSPKENRRSRSPKSPKETSKFQAIPGILNRRSRSSKSPKENRRSKSKSPKENRRSRSSKSPKENRRSRSPSQKAQDPKLSRSPAKDDCAACD